MHEDSPVHRPAPPLQEPKDKFEVALQAELMAG